MAKNKVAAKEITIQLSDKAAITEQFSGTIIVVADQQRVTLTNGQARELAADLVQVLRSAGMREPLSNIEAEGTFEAAE